MTSPVVKVGPYTYNDHYLHTVRNLHFWSKNSTLISRENCRFFGWKTRENVVVLDFLDVDNFDFTRKIVKKNWGEKLVKMLGFCQNWIFGQKFDFSNSVWCVMAFLNCSFTCSHTFFDSKMDSSVLSWSWEISALEIVSYFFYFTTEFHLGEYCALCNLPILLKESYIILWGSFFYFLLCWNPEHKKYLRVNVWKK